VVRIIAMRFRLVNEKNAAK